MRKAVVVIALVVLVAVGAWIYLQPGCGLSPERDTTTGSADTTTTSDASSVTLPAGWITFEGESISLALPESFEGGRPTEEDVAALIEIAAKLDPSGAVSAHELKTALEMNQYQLLVFGEPEIDGSVPNVAAQRHFLSSGMSMERAIEALYSEVPDDNVIIESITKDRAYVVVQKQKGAEIVGWQHVLFLRAGSYLYSVIYSFRNPALEPIFRTSAETVRVE